MSYFYLIVCIYENLIFFVSYVGKIYFFLRVGKNNFSFQKYSKMFFFICYLISGKTPIVLTTKYEKNVHGGNPFFEMKIDC